MKTEADSESSRTNKDTSVPVGLRKKSHRDAKVHNSANMEARRRLWKVVMLTALVWATTIDFVSADEEGTTEPPDVTMASTTTEPG